jgi:hypothetical protein
MPKDKKAKSILAQARLWATRNRLFGTQAFLRFVMFTFVEKINQVSNDFIFKGGNLLWIYIHTPRATVHFIGQNPNTIPSPCIVPPVGCLILLNG